MTKLTALLVLFAACASSDERPPDIITALQAKQPMIDRVQFDTATALPANPPPQVTATATGDAARAIYGATLALPMLLPGAYSCPADFGIIYNLTFYSGNDDVVAGTVAPTGCEIATLNAEIGSVSLNVNGAYWSLLAQNLGIDESVIFPYRHPTTTGAQ